MRHVIAVLAASAGLTLPALPAAAASDPCFNPPEARIVACMRPDASGLASPDRGIKLGRPLPTPSGSPAPSVAAAPGVAPRVAPPGPTPVLGRVDLALQFPSGSAVPTAGARARLDALGRQLSRPELADLHFRVEGHTDTTGSADLNQTLSERRAQAVVSYLTFAFHVPAERLQAVGKGEDDLPVNTGPDVAEPRNRVVRIVAIGS